MISTEQKKQSNLAITLLMAISAGIIAANIYYNQSILKDIGFSVHASENEIVKISMLSQLGFGVGILLLFPFINKLNLKKIVLVLCGLLVITLLLFSSATSFPEAAILSFLTGLFAVSVQLFLLIAATITKKHHDKSVNMIFSGILIGILSAKAFSAYISLWLNWRYVYYISAILVTIISILLKFYLPDLTPKFKGSFNNLFKAILAAVKDEQLFRKSALMGTFLFGIFCSFWIAITLSTSSMQLICRTGKVGLLGFIAMAAALVTPFLGTLTDKRNTFSSFLPTTVMIVISISLIKLFPFSIAVFMTGMFFLYASVQTMLTINFIRIYRADELGLHHKKAIHIPLYFIGISLGMITDCLTHYL